ncbi:MAG TPA: zf-HC2 domain-containing protein [Thermoanaerobaculia bacterium]|nr:zf-HC2 domain-containing protein [Thermoanaerobaculia bacterium]
MSGHGDPGEGFQASARALGEAARRSIKGHPEPELLLAYHERRLAEPEAARVRAHLVVCRECTDLVLDLAAFPEVPLRVPVEGEVEDLVPAWEEIVEAHREREQGAGPRRGGSSAVGFRVMVALAAGLCVVTVALAWRLATVSQELAEERAPQANVPTAPIRLHGATRGAEPEQVTVPAAARHLPFVVLAPAGETGPFRAVIFRLEGRPPRRPEEVPGLLPDPDGFLTFSLHRRSLPAGRYRLELRREEDGAALAEHLLLLSYDAGAGPGPPP